MGASVELVHDEAELASKGERRGKKRSARVERTIEIYEHALEEGALAVEIPMADEKEREHEHTFRSRLNSAAKALGFKAKVSVRSEEELAMVTFPEGIRQVAKRGTSSLRNAERGVFELHVRLTEEREQPMGTIIDPTPFEDLAEEGAKLTREAGENAYWVNPGRPDELSREGLLRTTYQEYQMHRHGSLDRVSVKEREIVGVLDLLKHNDSMTAREALEALRSDAGEASCVDQIIECKSEEGCGGHVSVCRQ